MEKLPTILLPSPLLEAIARWQQPTVRHSTEPEAIALAQQLQQLLSQTQTPQGMHHKPPKGHSETQFERDLWRYFPGKIHAGLMVKPPNYKQAYVPDFAYIDPELNLHIDIEVDEPYTHDTRQPLHYLGCPKDAQRNQFFLNSGWAIVRFSEAQVVKSPASCCKALASTIASITGDSSSMNAFRQIPTLKPSRRWTFSEAQAMAETFHRESYSLDRSQAEIIPKSKRKKSSQENKQQSVVTANFTFYCPECGEGPIRWQGHYICCPNCSYDAFAL